MGKHLILIFLLCWTLSGCATIARGSNVDMVVDTEPQGAVVTTDLETKKSVRARLSDPSMKPEYYGCPATPCEFEMSRRSEFIMTINHPGYEPVEIGVDHSLHKESLNANVAGSTGAGVVAGATMGLAGASFASAGLATSGAVVGATAIAAASVTAGFAVIGIGVDSATGAMQNLNPNPVFLVLPPEGTKFEPDPKVQEVKNKRAAKTADKTSKIRMCDE